jgi:Protein of unknown function (DUF3043)
VSSRSSRKRRSQAAGAAPAGPRRAVTARAEPAPSTGARAAGSTATDDAALAPWDRGPVRAYLRDVVDARRHLLGVLFVPAFGLAMITTFGPASDLQRLLLKVSLVALAVVLVEAVARGMTYTRMARAQFPDVPVNAVSSTFYAFMRAHRPRSLRKPPPRVRPS